MSEQGRRPRVSIGMPVYNREKYVAAAIEANLNQTYADFELVITDNASTDRSEEICRAYAAKDPRVKFHRNPRNLGAAGNYRRCFELSVGEYFRWTPSDDLVSSNLLERAIQVLDSDPTIMVAYGRTKLIDDQGHVTADFDERLHIMDERPSDRWMAVMRQIRLGNLHYGLTRAAKLRRTGLLRNYSGGDFPLIAEMALYGKFFELPDSFFYRRMHEEASSALPSNKDIMAFYDPGKREKFFAREWTHWGAHFLAATRARIPIGEKLRLCRLIARWAVWGRTELFRELTDAVRYAAHKVIGI